MVYSTAERVEIIFIYGAEHSCARASARVFNERHPDKNVDARYILDLVQKFQDTGSVVNKKRAGNRVVDEMAQLEVLGHFAMDPTSSLRNISTATGLSYSSVRKVTKLHKFHPYKMKTLQELGEDDFDRRLQFCEIMTEKIIVNPNLIKNICFSDECTFFLNGSVNKHNVRYWSDENPYIFREGHTQVPQKLNVWAGILGNAIVGPIFIDGTLNGGMYLELLDNVIDPLITEQLENQRDPEGNPMLDEYELFYQHDGAPPHYAINVRNWLNHRFPLHWIGRRGTIEWPPRSPDLTALDFFLWGHLKSVVYKTQPTSLDDLRERIINECRRIPPETFRKVQQEFENRLYYCMERGGAHFENLL